MKKITPFIAAAILTTGCATPLPNSSAGTLNNIVPMYRMTARFDADAARAQLESGKNTIKGSAFIRQKGGGIVTCAGQIVELIPATEYAAERMRAIYQNSTSGFDNDDVQYRFIPDHPDFASLKRTTRCDVQGNFVFERISDGEFYLTTEVDWQVLGKKQGGKIMRRVRVSGSEIINVIMVP